MEQSDWIEANQSKFLTIKRVKELLSESSEIKVLALHRNIFDETLRNDENISYNPTHFFGGSYWVIRKGENRTFPNGENRTFPNGENKEENKDKILDNLLVSFSTYDINAISPFEFDLYLEEYKCWYPLEDGYIPQYDEQGIFKFNFSEPKHYSTFDENTKIGCRGPMILWSEIDDNQKIYYRYPD